MITIALGSPYGRYNNRPIVGSITLNRLIHTCRWRGSVYVTALERPMKSASSRLFDADETYSGLKRTAQTPIRKNSSVALPNVGTYIIARVSIIFAFCGCRILTWCTVGL